MSHIALNLDIERPNESLTYKRGYPKLTKFILTIGDLLILNITSFIIYGSIYKIDASLFSTYNFYVTLFYISNLAWLVNVYLLNIYSVSRISKWESIIWNITKAVGFHFFLIAFYISSLKKFSFSIHFYVEIYVVFFIMLIIWRILFILITNKIRSNERYKKKVIIVGGNKASQKIYNYFLMDKTEKFKLEAVFGDTIDKPKNGEIKFQPENLLFDFLNKEKIDELYCSWPLNEFKKIRELMSYAENHLIRFKYVPDFRALLYKKVDIDFYGQVPVLSVRKEPLENITNTIAKRAFDIVFSMCILLFIFPFLFPIIAILIKKQSRGPVFFKQLRSGKDNKEFYCYKFRTMVLNEGSDKIQATKSDERITSIGKILRKTNLDELPQFFNVLKGEMSVIGPRPHMIKHTEEYQKRVDKFMIRHFVKPGITGWAQVNGFRGITETPKKMIKRVRYDVWYIENWSMVLDFKIVIMTILNMFKGEKNAF